MGGWEIMIQHQMQDQNLPTMEEMPTIGCQDTLF
jgi:hypothetical protein